MGNQKGQSDPVYDTHEKYYENVAQECHATIIENVPEYSPDVIQAELGDEWDMKHAVIDPRVFGVGAARSRLYAICWKKDEVTWRKDVVMEEVIELLTSTVATNASDFYWQQLPKTQLTPAQVFWLLNFFPNSRS